MFFSLPNEIIRLIYEFDGTYKDIFSKNILVNFTPYEYEYFDNGQLYRKYQMKDNIANGNYSEYDENGHLFTQHQLKNNIPDGNYLEYHANGRIKYRLFYKNGLAHGKLYKFYESGILRFESMYKFSLLDGISKVYSPDGKLLSEYVFINNIKTEQKHF